MDTYPIIWQKEYHEDLGAQDENGFFDYAYYYFIYVFQLPDKSEIKIRQYTDTIDECSLFLPSNYFEKMSIRELLEVDCVAALVNFMRETQGIKQCFCFDGEYKLFDLYKVKNDFAEYFFVEISDR